MAKKKGGQKTPSYGFAADKGKNGKKLDSYEDTLEPGTVDDFMFKRDRIMFNPQNESEDEIDDGGEEIMAIPSRRRRDEVADQNDDDDIAEDDEDDAYAAAPSKKARKERTKEDVSGKGRFGKPIVDSDASDEDGSGSGSSGSGSDSESEEEGWGRQYYAMPSSRRAKQDLDGDEYNEQREQDRELEEREVRRLQRKAREALTVQDFGLEDDEVVPAQTAQEEEEEEKQEVPLPDSSDPAVLLRHMETHDPVKLALAREWPLVVQKLEKTQRGMRKVEAQTEGQLHKGLGWLHYQTLVTYASTLAFYIHLAALPPLSRPDLSSHPILARLLQLKKGLSDLENLDFDAASDDGENPLMPNGWGVESDSDADGSGDEELDEEEKESRELVRNKKAMIARLQSGETEEDGDGEEWMKEGLDEDELADLLADAEADQGGAMASKKGKKSKGEKKANKDKGEGKKGKKSKKRAQAEDEDEMDFGDRIDYDAILAGLKDGGGEDDDEDALPKKKKSKKAKKTAPTPAVDTDAGASGSSSTFQPLAEPDFFSSSAKSSSSRRTKRPRDTDGLDTSGDPTALLDADAADKDQRKRSLAFHTSKIASTAARRAAAREKRMGGDEDVPYRDRQAARDAALRKQIRGSQGEGAELDGREASEADLKRARAIRGDFDGDDDDDFDADMNGGGGRDEEAEGYYALVKRARTSSKAAKQAAHDAEMDERLASRIGDEQYEDGEAGPRSLTRAIEKNRGLTQRRAKSGRNPRVKKRQAYEKAKQKVGSQRAVFKGGQASLGGRYAGEKTGISTVIKSAKF